MSRYKEFIKKSEKVAFDRKHREIINFNISKYDFAVEAGKKRYSNIELAKQRASYIKDKTLENLDVYLEQFESQITSHGAKVLWARDSREAIDHIIPILREAGVEYVVKSKSMITEEIELNDYLKAFGIEPIETDLGEYIVQLAGEKPYHIVTPAMHKSKKDVARLFHEKFHTPENSSPEFLTQFVRDVLREKFINAGAGITGANFLVADVGGVCLTENEGNGIMSTSFPKVHIVIAGIEKIIPSVNDLALLWPLLATYGTGQQISVYNTLFTGPRQKGETDGPEKMYVILLDNGRTKILENKELYKALKCIRCGACLNACPVYKNIGGYTYDSTYSGPIGSVITPYFKGMEEFNYLSFASTICGKCTEVCPVKIPLHQLLLVNRRDSVEKGYGKFSWNVGMKVFKNLMLHRRLLDTGGGRLKNVAVYCFGKNVFGSRKKLPYFATHSFSKQWKKRYRSKNPGKSNML